VAASVHSRALRKAAEILGGRAKLARYLRVPEAELQKWLEDQGKPPTAIFLRAVDLIVDETPAPSDDPDPPAPRDCAGDSPATRY
jgi:hypothetical protein